jgi:hypothetical protein
MNPVSKLFFKDNIIRTFFVARLQESQVEEKVFLKKGATDIDISKHHAMICLDPFCIAIWLSKAEVTDFDTHQIKILFKKGDNFNASIKASLIENMDTANGVLLLCKIEKVKNRQLSPLHRLLFFGWLIKSKANTYYSRKVVAALYSYPRKIIIVSYADENYCNIFPMDIQGYIEEEDIYLLGLRTTNVTLTKILDAKKVVVCDTDIVDLDTVYKLGKHSSKAPAPRADLPFGTSKSETFGFPVPDFTSSYKEIEIIRHKKMGYHMLMISISLYELVKIRNMLMIGKVVNSKTIRPNPSSLYHIGFLQFKTGNYKPIEGLF